MTYLLGAEWLKMRKRWMPRVIVLIMLAIIALVFWGIGTSASDRPNLFFPRGWVVALFMAASFGPFIWPVLGGSWAGNEYSWGTIRMILSRRPNRIQFVTAGLIILLIAVFIALIATLILATVAGAVVALLTNHSITVSVGSSFYGTLVKCFLATFLVLGFYIVLSYTTGSIFRSAAAGIGVGIGISVAQLIIIGIFVGLGGAWKTVAEHFPYAYTMALPQRLTADATTGHFVDSSSNSPSVMESVTGILVYIAVLLVVTAIVVRSRDVTA